MKLLICTLLIFSGFVVVKSQCVVPPGFVCVTQSDADRTKKDLNELLVDRDTITKQGLALAATDTERAAWLSFKAASDSTIATLQKGIVDREAVITLQEKALALYEDLVEKLTAKLTAPKSSFQKFMSALRDIALVAAGVTLGRGHL